MYIVRCHSRSDFEHPEAFLPGAAGTPLSQFPSEQPLPSSGTTVSLSKTIKSRNYFPAVGLIDLAHIFLYQTLHVRTLVDYTCVLYRQASTILANAILQSMRKYYFDLSRFVDDHGVYLLNTDQVCCKNFQVNCEFTSVLFVSWSLDIFPWWPSVAPARAEAEERLTCLRQIATANQCDMSSCSTLHAMLESRG